MFTRYTAVATADSSPFRAIGGEESTPFTGATPAPPTCPQLLSLKAKALTAQLSLKAKVALAVLAVVSISVGLGVGLRKRAPAAAASVCDWAAYRLPTNVLPTNYTITWAPSLTPDSAAFAAGSGCAGGSCPFSGSSMVDVVVQSASPCILVHSAGLRVVSAAVANLRSGAAAAAAWREDAANERLVVTNPVAAGVGDTLRLTFFFSANLSQTNNGLYQSTFTNDLGATVTMVATQFEATAARKAFVGFDEPAFKANFTLTFDGVPRGYTALGNMPNASVATRSDGAATVTFAPSPRMSTYLLCVVVGPLVSVSSVVPAANGPLPLAGWAVARGNNSKALAFAVEAATAIIPFYERLFGVPFPLPKMDMAAIPDFAAGAMENWGLITYRETAMLAVEGVNSATELQRVVVVVAHELAHQWNGDIVTMAWWNALWLNEGFAARMEYLGTDFFRPAYGIGKQFQYGTVIRALRADAFSDVQQLTQDVDSSAAIEGQFSSISYQKGASVLRMVQTFLGDATFFKGINTYLKRYVFGNSEPLGLWQALRDAAGTVPSLPTWAQTYELQPGFPLVRVAWASSGSEASGSGVLQLSQQRFFASPASAAAAGAAEAARLYWVPLQFASPGAARAGSPLPAAAAAAAATPFTGATWGATVGAAGAPFDLALDGWLKVGVNGTFYGRVTYPPSLWGALFAGAAAAQAGGGGAAAALLTPADRATLLDDYLTLAESTALAGEGLNSTQGLSYLAALLPAEREYEPLSVALLHVSIFSALLVPDVPLDAPDAENADPLAAPADRACFLAYTRFAAQLLEGPLSYVTWDPIAGETPLITQLRASVLSAGAAVNHNGTVAQARALFAAYDAAGGYPSGAAALPVDVASVVLNTAVRFGGEAEYRKVLAWFEAAQTAGDAASYTRFLRAATATRDRGLLQETVTYVLDKSTVVRVGDRVGVITGVAGNPWGRDVAWRGAVAEGGVWASLIALYGSGGFDTSALVGGLAGGFVSQASLDAVVAAWGPAGALRSTISGALFDYEAAVEGVGRSVLWAQKEKAAVCAALAGY